MVTDALLDFLADVWGWLVGSFPAPTPTGWSSSVASGIGVIVGLLSDLGSWLPLRLIGAIMATYLLFWLMAGGIILGRMLLSLLTGGGGNAHVS